MDFHHVSPKRIFMDFALSGFFSIFSQWIFTMSPQRELSWILPSVVFFLFFPSGFSPCLLRENFHGFFPKWLLFYFSPVDFYCIFSRGNHGFCLQQLYIFIPQRIFTMSTQKEQSWTFSLNGLSFSSPMDTVSP